MEGLSFTSHHELLLLLHQHLLLLLVLHEFIAARRVKHLRVRHPTNLSLVDRWQVLMPTGAELSLCDGWHHLHLLLLLLLVLLLLHWLLGRLECLRLGEREF